MPEGGDAGPGTQEEGVGGYRCTHRSGRTRVPRHAEERARGDNVGKVVLFEGQRVIARWHPCSWLDALISWLEHHGGAGPPL